MKMSHIAVFIMLALGFLFYSNEVKSFTVYDLTVEFGYTPPSEPAVYGFRLYLNGTSVVTWDNPTLFTRDLIISLPETTPSSFTLTAVFTDGTESPHSDPYLFTPESQSKPVAPANFIRIASIFGKYFNKDTDKIRRGRIFLPAG
jgi:hypothetical protein